MANTKRFECRVRHQDHIFIYTELINGQKILTSKRPAESAIKKIS